MGEILMIFPKSEYEARYLKCQFLMKEARIDVLMLTKGSNIFYFSGYRTSLFSSHFRPFVLLIPQSGEPSMIVPNLEWFSASKEVWFDDVVFWGPGGNASDPISSVQSVFKSRGFLNSVVGTELDIGQRLGMSYQEFDQLKQMLPKCSFVNGTGITWELRMVKSPAELECMKEATRITCCGYEALISNARKGMTEKEMQMIVASEMMSQGCEQEYFLSIGAGPERYSIMNPLPTDYAVKDGDLVLMDWGAVVNGYWSDLTRVFAIGSINERQMELYNAANRIRETAITATRPGVPIGEVDVAATRMAEMLGVREYMLHRSGHTIGLEVHEIPSISAADRTIMKPGMCLTIEPALYDWPDGGSFRIEDLVVVTENGNEVYSPCTTDLIVIDR